MEYINFKKYTEMPLVQKIDALRKIKKGEAIISDKSEVESLFGTLFNK
jgi:hypothetical protein